MERKSELRADPEVAAAWRRRSQERARQRQRDKASEARNAPPAPKPPRRPSKAKQEPAGRMCAVPGCKRPHFARGYCNTHYYRVRRNGTLGLKPKGDWQRKRGRKPKQVTAYRRRSDERDLAIRELYVVERLSTTEVGARLGLDPSNVARALRRMAVSTRRTEDYAAALDLEEVLRRYEAGEGYSAIAKALGISTKRAKDALVGAGIELRPRGAVPGVGAGGQPSTYESEFNRLRVQVKRRSRGWCELRCSPNCQGRSSPVHHRLRRGQGGPNTMENLVDLCQACHGFVHAHPALSYEKGWLLRMGADPQGVPWERGYGGAN